MTFHVIDPNDRVIPPALALVTALINSLPVGRQRRLLAEASVLLSDLPGMNRDEAHRIIHAMRAQIAG